MGFSYLFKPCGETKYKKTGRIKTKLKKTGRIKAKQKKQGCIILRVDQPVPIQVHEPAQANMSQFQAASFKLWTESDTTFMLRD